MTSNSFLVGLYTDDQHFSIKLDSSSLRVEDVCKECASRLQISGPLIQLFSLFHVGRRIWLSPNHLLTGSDCGKEIEYMFRIRFHPEITIKNDKFIHYLRLQYRHCFTKEFELDTMKSSNLFGLGVFDMLTDSYEKGWTRNSNVFQCRRYERFFPKRKLENYNMFQQLFLKYNLRKHLLQKHMEYNGNYRLQGMGNTYIDKIKNEFYSQITKETYTYEDKAGNQKFVTVGEKDSEFVVCFEEETYCLKLVKSVMIRNNLVEIYFNRCSSKMFKMEPAVSESFVSAMDGLYRLAYNYHYGICDEMLSPRIRKLQTLGCYDHIREDVAADILMKAEHECCFLMRMMPNDTETFDVFTLDTQNSQILKYTVGPNESLENLRETHSFLQHKLKPKHFEWCDLLFCYKTVVSKEPSSFALERNNRVFLPSEIYFPDEKPIHQGVFTETYQAKIKDCNIPLVGIKTLKEFPGSHQYTQVFMEGISRMLELGKCSSFLRVKGIIMEPKLGLVTEFPYQSVYDYLAFNDQLPLKYILKMALTVAEGLEFLRKQGIVHGDISCENLQMIDVNSIKITDASIVNKLYLLPKNNVIYKSRLPWIDPLLRSKPTFESDIFSYGTLLCQLLCLQVKPPKQNQVIHEAPCRLLFNISEDEEEKAQNARTVKEQLHEIILKCRSYKMEDRPQPQDISAKIIGFIDEPSMQERLPMGPPNNGMCDHAWNTLPIMLRDIPDTIKCVEEKTRKLKFPKPAPAYEIDENNLKIEKQIGKGGFGKVYKATYSTPAQKRTVAMKENIDGPKLNSSELEIMENLKHERVVDFIGICSDKWIVMEYVAGGDLLSKLKSSKTLIHNLKNILLGITEGMTYLQKMGVIHRDLAARNILITVNNDVKITDFGMSTMTESGYYRIKTSRCLPIKWCAPEQKKITSKSDVWSFGVVMWECYSLGADPILCTVLTFANYLDLLKRGKRLNKPDKCPDVMYKIMKDCWKLEPDERPDFDSLRSRILVEA